MACGREREPNSTLCVHSIRSSPNVSLEFRSDLVEREVFNRPTDCHRFIVHSSLHIYQIFLLLRFASWSIKKTTSRSHQKQLIGIHFVDVVVVVAVDFGPLFCQSVKHYLLCRPMNLKPIQSIQCVSVQCSCQTAISSSHSPPLWLSLSLSHSRPLHRVGLFYIQ